VVFFPVLFLLGVARNLFMPLALTIAFALIMSFFVSRTVTPLLCLYWLQGRESAVREGERPTRVKRFTSRVEGWLDALDHRYARALQWVLGHRALTISTILGVFVLSLLLAKRIGTEFFPDSRRQSEPELRKPSRSAHGWSRWFGRRSPSKTLRRC
jgi:multidrug efflux pump subunit AcrB